MKAKKTRSLRFCPKCGKYCYTLAGSFAVARCLECKVKGEPTGLALAAGALILTIILFVVIYLFPENESTDLICTLLMGFIWLFPFVQWQKQARLRNKSN